MTEKPMSVKMAMTSLRLFVWLSGMVLYFYQASQFMF